MKFTLSWLKLFLNTDKSLSEIETKLTELGMEVEEVIDSAAALESFRAAKIIKAEKHPNSDKLSVCQVDNGKEILQIVCGAPNARTGIMVALAPIGSVIPLNGMEIKKTKIRDVESNGMLCSAYELKISNLDDGVIIELPETAKIGDAIAPIFGLDDIIIEISITPNRGDALGVYGIARDLAASGMGTLINPFKLHPDLILKPAAVKVENIEDAARFDLAYFENINNQGHVEFISKFLDAIGSKSISKIVDITNFMTFSFARPMHAYDGDKVKGAIKVRKAVTGEKFISLDNKEYSLCTEDLVVADEEKVLALAGVIGGLSSACDENTKNIILEVALFDPEIVAAMGRRYQIDSDARFRFERKIDPCFMDDALKIASQLILDHCGFTNAEYVSINNLNFEPKKVIYPKIMTEKLGGIKIKPNKVIKILENLGCKVKDLGDELEIIVPSYRNDIAIKQDILEEILRINGYNNIESASLPVPQSRISSDLKQKFFHKSKELLSLRGMNQAITLSFISSNIAQKYHELNEALFLQNPISNDIDYMKETLVPSLIEALERNAARSIDSLALFEVASTYHYYQAYTQKMMIAGVRAGKNVPKNIHSFPRNFDIFDIKADMFVLLELAGVKVESLQYSSSNLPSYYHPGKSSSLMQGKNILGFFGEIHPEIAKIYDINSEICIFELFVDNINFTQKKKTQKSGFNISPYQSVSRDFAFILDKEIAVSDLLLTIKSTNKELIREVSIFDIYEGVELGENKKSVAINILLQSLSKTLSEEELSLVSNKIIENVATRYKATLRG